MLALRRAEPALRTGRFAWVDLPDAGGDVLAFERGDGADVVGCVVNLGAAPVDLPDDVEVLLSSAPPPADGPAGATSRALPPDTAAWYRGRPRP